MGYYTGPGVCSGGNSHVSAFQTFLLNGGYHVAYQETNSSVTRKAGVQLSTATGTGGSCSLSNYRFQIGVSWFTLFNCKGSSSSVTYSRVGDSNLYVMETTINTIRCKVDDGGWQS